MVHQYRRNPTRRATTIHRLGYSDTDTQICLFSKFCHSMILLEIASTFSHWHQHLWFVTRFIIVQYYFGFNIELAIHEISKLSFHILTEHIIEFFRQFIISTYLTKTFMFDLVNQIATFVKNVNDPFRNQICASYYCKHLKISLFALFLFEVALCLCQ